MQISSNPSIQKYVAICLVGVIVIWAIGYVLDQKTTILFSDFTYIPLTTILAITSLFQAYQIRQDHKKILVWYVFTIFAVTYCIAQHIWSVNEIVLDIKPFPSFADVAFTISTISLVTFFILTIKSKNQFIARWMYAVAIPPSCFVFLLSGYFFMMDGGDVTLEGITSLMYPVLDSIALAPALIGILLYCRKKMDFATCLISISMIPLTIGDILFQFMDGNGTYYSGSISDLFFYIQITLLILGIYIISNCRTRSNVSIT